jgi:hypothetical protein
LVGKEFIGLFAGFYFGREKQGRVKQEFVKNDYGWIFI